MLSSVGLGQMRWLLYKVEKKKRARETAVSHAKKNLSATPPLITGKTEELCGSIPLLTFWGGSFFVMVLSCALLIYFILLICFFETGLQYVARPNLKLMGTPSLAS